MCWSSRILLAVLLAAAPAAAEPPACRLCSTAEGLIDSGRTKNARPMALEVQTSLDFDQVILTGPAGGTATLSPTGARQTSGSLSTLTGRAMIGEVVISGEPGREVRVELPARIDLFGNAGGTLAITRITSDLPAGAKLNDEGRLRVRFGGELFIRGDAEGEYRGDVPITVDYI